MSSGARRAPSPDRLQQPPRALTSVCPGNSAPRRPCLAERHHPPLLLIPKREPDAGEAVPETEPAADLFELGMVPQHLGKPVEGNAARQVMHVMHADVAGEPGKRRR